MFEAITQGSNQLMMFGIPINKFRPRINKTMNAHIIILYKKSIPKLIFSVLIFLDKFGNV